MRNIITATLHLAGIETGQNRGFQAYSKIVLLAESIFEYLEFLEDILQENGWSIIGIENVIFDHSAEFPSDEIFIHTYRLN